MPSPTPVDYTARAYDDIRDSLIARIPSHLPEWRDRTEHDFGIVLIELFAYMGDMLSFYIDRAANESSLQTAILRESVLSFAHMLGYVPYDMSPSTGSVTFSAAPSRLVDTVIPAGTKLQTDTPNSDAPTLDFTTDEELTILTTLSTGSVNVTQGKIISGELIGTSNDGASQEYSLFQIGVVVDSVMIQVIIGGDVTSQWVRLDSLLTAGPADQVFTVRIDANGVAFVRFGDGANGMIPPMGSEIRSTYRIADGGLGNVAANIVTVIPEVVDGVMSVTNPLSLSGGVDRESVDSIRYNLPGSVAAINRAVTIEDFEPLAKQVVGVLHAKAAAVVYTSVNLYVVPAGGGLPSDELIADIEEWFSTRSLIGTDVTVLDPDYVGVNIELDLAVLPTYYAEETEERVVGALQDLLSLGAVDLGYSITPSAVYRAVLAVPGVDYCDLTLLAREDVTQTGTLSQHFAVDEAPVAGAFVLDTIGGL